MHFIFLWVLYSLTEKTDYKLIWPPAELVFFPCVLCLRVPHVLHRGWHVFDLLGMWVIFREYLTIHLLTRARTSPHKCKWVLLHNADTQTGGEGVFQLLLSLWFKKKISDNIISHDDTGAHLRQNFILSYKPMCCKRPVRFIVTA